MLQNQRQIFIHSNAQMKVYRIEELDTRQLPPLSWFVN